MFRKFLGWIVNFYPNTVFYSKRFLPDLVFTEGKTPHASMGQTALLGVAVSAGRSLVPGDTLSAEFTGVTDKGTNVGDYLITVKRLR